MLLNNNNGLWRELGCLHIGVADVFNGLLQKEIAWKADEGGKDAGRQERETQPLVTSF